MPVVFKHLVVSRVSFRTIMLRCITLCTLVSGKLDKVHSSWTSTLSKTLWKVIMRCVQKDISSVKTGGDLIVCVLEC